MTKVARESRKGADVDAAGEGDVGAGAGDGGPQRKCLPGG